MSDSIFDFLSELMNGNIWYASFASFSWGILSIILSPCHLSSIPLIMGFLGSQENVGIKRAFTLSLVFSLGILIIIAFIGAATLSLGRLMGDLGPYGNYFVAAVFFFIGLYLMDIISLDRYSKGVKGTKYKGLPAALVLGLIFGIGLGPCAFAFMAPVLAVVFEVSSTDSMLAASLLAAFSAGHIAVIVAAGTLAGKAIRRLNRLNKSKITFYFKKACGALVIAGGVYLIFQAY